MPLARNDRPDRQHMTLRPARTLAARRLRDAGPDRDGAIRVGAKLFDQPLADQLARRDDPVQQRQPLALRRLHRVSRARLRKRCRMMDEPDRALDLLVRRPGQRGAIDHAHRTRRRGAIQVDCMARLRQGRGKVADVSAAALVRDGPRRQIEAELGHRATLSRRAPRVMRVLKVLRVMRVLKIPRVMRVKIRPSLSAHAEHRRRTVRSVGRDCSPAPHRQ